MEEKLRNTTLMRLAKTGYIVISAGLCALGLLMMALPGLPIALAGRLLGGMMIAFGAVKIIGYWSKDLYRLAFQYDLAFGILLLLFGMFALLRPGQTASLFYTALGIVILADGMFKLQISIDAKAFGLELWWLIFALALFAGAAGCALVFHPTGGAKVATALIGVSLFGEGALNLCVALSAVKIIRHQRVDERAGMLGAKAH